MSLDRTTPNTRIWKTIRRLDCRAMNTPPNAAIKFTNRAIRNAKALASAFNKQYTNITRHKTDKYTRVQNRELLKLAPENLYYSTHCIKKVIKTCSNSRAFGPDGLCIQFLKNMGPKALSYFAALINHSLNHFRIPAIWNSSVIIPLMKPGKKPGESKSYRHVSLISPAAKVIEKLLLKHLYLVHQRGFRSDISPPQLLV